MIEVLLVGTYHMGNPGADIANLVADDVRTPERQAQLEQVVRNLGRFAPTKVAVEWSGDTPEGTLTAYTRFTPAQLLEDPNEVVQLGFRLAAHAGHTTVYGIDVPGEFPFEAVQEKAEREGRSAELGALVEGLQKRVEALQERLAAQTIGEYLAELNQPDAREESARLHMALLAFDDPTDAPGIRLALSWYERNLHIQLQLMKIAVPGDRIVVFYGAGHSYWLGEQLRTTPGYRVVEPLAYLTEERS